MARIECLTCGALVKIGFKEKVLRRVICQVCSNEMVIDYGKLIITDAIEDMELMTTNNIDRSSDWFEYQ
jgi:hypothetical protein